MIALWLGDLAEPVCALIGAALFVALALAHWSARARTWARPTLPPPRRRLTADEVAERFVRDLVEFRDARHDERGVRIRAWHYSWGHVLQWAIEVDAHTARVGSLEQVRTIVRDAVLLARGGEPS